MRTEGSGASGAQMDDLDRYRSASQAFEATQSEIEELEQTEAFEVFQKQLGLLRRRLLNSPQSLRQMFIDDGMQAIVWEFKQDALGRDFTRALWRLLLRDDDMSAILLRFVWNVPLKFKRKFIAAIDAHLSDRYPMFKGLSRGWPAQNGIPPYIRSPEERARDFELVNQGYLGYMSLGYSAREVDLFVWLETLRDKQCEDRACELGVPRPGREPRGGCPVKIHIPEMLRLLGTGKFTEALELIESCNPLPDVTGRICPQELQCQGVCTLTGRPIEIGQLEWFLPEREKLAKTSRSGERLKSYVSPWAKAEKPPIAVVGSGPAGLINAYLLAAEGYPVTIFEAFHELGGVLRYGIPEFRLPNSLIDDVVGKIRLLGGRFVANFVVGKTATIEDLKAAGFWKIFVGTGAGLPRFMNVPGEHLLGVMSANEFLTRVNLMQARLEDYETPLPEVKDKHVIVIGGGNTAMDAARTAKRLGGIVTIVYRRTQAEMPARVEELHHALEEGIELMVLRSPREFVSEKSAHVCQAVLDVMELGPPDASGRRAPVVTGKTETMPVDLVIMALGNASNPIIKDTEPDLKTTKWGTHQRRRRLAEDLARRRLFRRRRDPRRSDRRSRRRRRTGGGARDRRRHSVLQGRDRGPRRARRALHRRRPGAADHPQEGRSGRRHRRDDGEVAAHRQGGSGRAVRAPAADAEGRAHSAHARRLGRPRGHDRSGRSGGRRQHHRHQRHGGRRSLQRDRRPARPAQQAASRRGRSNRCVLRRRPRPAAGFSDHAGASEARQPRDPDRRLPHREPPLLDRRRRARRPAQEGVSGTARGDLRQQRRHLRRQGFCHRAARGAAEAEQGRARAGRSPR